MQFDTGYKLPKRQTGSRFNLQIILSDIRFHNSFQFVKYDASA